MSDHQGDASIETSTWTDERGFRFEGVERVIRLVSDPDGVISNFDFKNRDDELDRWTPVRLTCRGCGFTVVWPHRLPDGGYLDIVCPSCGVSASIRYSTTTRHFRRGKETTLIPHRGFIQVDGGFNAEQVHPGEPTIEDLRKRRFALFGYLNYYPCGGWQDLLGLFPSAEEASSAAKAHNNAQRGERFDHYDIIDLWTEAP